MLAFSPLSLIAKNALFVVNHSGGKDSQVTLIEMLKVIPKSQLVVVHASLGEIEWEGALELARDQAAAAGVPFLVARAGKTFLEMVERKSQSRPEVPSWPSAKHRQCTSDLKRDPIVRVTKAYAKAHGFSTIVDCVGIRAQESASRSKLAAFKVNKRENGKADREWFSWLPIFTMKTDQVFAAIAAAGQKPHPAYAAGNDRLSCLFCIMGSARDLANGARHAPDMAARYIAMEARTGYTMHMSRKSLAQLIAEGEALLG
jgi:3'-phosphoadenosine 5'-phosphosulfate sulfotransferase (PAPS reductase)/FAD synthetase